jgi:DNA-directed RNA polymerase specialized sigma24 family protein
VSKPKDPWFYVIRRAAGGDSEAQAMVYHELKGSIRLRVTKTLLRRRWGRDVGQEAMDLTQHIFEELFADGGAKLLGWDPDLGASLRSYVGWLADKRADSYLTPRGMSSEELGDGDAASSEPPSNEDSPELASIDRDLVERILEELAARVSPRVLRLFYLTVVEGRDTEEVCARMEMTPDAVQKARDRLCKLIKQIHAELVSGEKKR